MGVNDLNILFVLAQQAFEVLIDLLNTLGKVPYRFRLRGRDSSVDPFGSKKNFISEIVTAHAFWVSHRVDLSKDLDEFRAFLCILYSIENDPTAGLFLLFNCGQISFCFDCFRNIATCVSFYKHELEYIDLLVSCPRGIELFQVFGHVLHHILNSDVDCVFDDPFV